MENFEIDIAKAVTKCIETKEEFIFQTISDFALMTEQIEIEKRELIAAIRLIRESRAMNTPYNDPAMKIAYTLGYKEGTDNGKVETMEKLKKYLEENCK